MNSYNVANVLKNNPQEYKKLFSQMDLCDKYDYLSAVACGVIGGLVDSFFVGCPGDSKLGNWTDEQVNQCIIKFAKKNDWKPKKGNENNVKSAIGHLERKSNINYDQRKPSDVDGKVNLSPGSHHLQSLAHSPDVIGLFFSVLNQFTSTSSFISDGQLITISTDKFELQGGNFVSKLFCGVTNWFFHLMSDMAGSSGAHKRGSGIAVPFYELLQFCEFGSFNVNKDKKTLAELAQCAFREGYDFRHGIAMSIPCFITEASIRLIWSLRRFFQYKQPFKKCIPIEIHSSLRIMLIVGNATLCLFDIADAGIRTLIAKGDTLAFFIRLNFVAWYKFAMRAILQICLWLGVKNYFEEGIYAIAEFDYEIKKYLNSLSEIDTEKYKSELASYNKYVANLSNATTEEELNTALIMLFKELNIETPWEGEFDTFMANKENFLEFKKSV